jgi:hypothetical protein
MQRLSNGGRTGVFLAALVVILIALLSPGWIGAVLTIMIVGLLAALMRRTWSVQTAQTRVLRVGVLLLLVVLAFLKI